MFTTKQQILIDSYCGNIKEAAEKAGLGYGWARQLLTKPNIKEAIQKRQDTEKRPITIATRQKRQEFWTKVMDDETEDMKDRLKASELLGKSEADFTENINTGETKTYTPERCDKIRSILAVRCDFET